MVSGINSLNFSPNPYGSIKRTDIVKNGRIYYDVINSHGKSAGKLSVPVEEADVFESSYDDIITTAPEIKSYVDANSSPYDIKHRKNLSIATVAGGGIIGGTAAAVTTMGMRAGAKRVLTIVLSSLAGLGAGFAASVMLTTPPGSFKFAKASRTLDSLDIQRSE